MQLFFKGQEWIYIYSGSMGVSSPCTGSLKAQFVEVVRPEIVGTETGNGVNLSLLLGERDQNPVIDPVNASSATEFRLDVDEVGVLGQPAVSCHKYIWLR